MPTGAAIVGGAVIGGISSERASERAAEGSERAAAQIAAAGADARRDVLDLFPLAQQDLLSGARGAFDIFSQGLTGQQQALQQGNINAQQTISAGLPQIQAALLGIQAPQGNAFAPQGINLANAPINPFSAAGGGQIGAAPQFQTGQGAFQDTRLTGTPNSRFLNPFAAGLDRAGFIQRDPGTGIPGIDFAGGQRPGSAAAINPGGGGLSQLAFERALADQRRRGG